MAKDTGFVKTRSVRVEERIKQDEEELEQMTKAQQEDQEPEQEQEELSAEEQTFKKRYGDLRRHAAEKEKKLQERLEELENKLAKASTKEIKPPASDEDLAAWKKKYPDVARIVETMAIKIADDKVKATQADLESLRGYQQRTKKERAISEIKEAHPDFDDLSASDEFHDWVESQSKWVQDALYENEEDSSAVISVLDLYKAKTGLSQKAVEKSAAKGVKTRERTSLDAESTKGKIRESEVAKMSSREYEKNEAAIMEAMRNGNFVYDLSAGAR